MVWNLCIVHRKVFNIHAGNAIYWERNSILCIGFCKMKKEKTPIGWHSIELEQLANCVNNDVSPISYRFDHLWHTLCSTTPATAIISHSYALRHSRLFCTLRCKMDNIAHKLYNNILYIFGFIFVISNTIAMPHSLFSFSHSTNS